MIERHHLRILSEIHRLGSVSKAADSLFITQPAVTHAVKRLEHIAGIKLWKKKGRHIVLTEAGQFLVRGSDRILPQLKRLDETLQHFAAGELHRFYIGVECYLNCHWLIDSIANFCSQNQSLEVDIKSGCRFAGINAVLNHDIDLLVSPDPVSHPKLCCIDLFKFELVLAVSSNHRLAERSFIQPSDLEKEVLYVYPVNEQRLDIFSQFLSPANCLPRLSKTMECEPLMMHAVAQAKGVACIPHWNLSAYPSIAVKGVRLSESGLFKRMCLLFRKEDEHYRSLQRLINYLAENAPANHLV